MDPTNLRASPWPLPIRLPTGQFREVGREGGEGSGTNALGTSHLCSMNYRLSINLGLPLLPCELLFVHSWLVGRVEQRESALLIPTIHVWSGWQRRIGIGRERQII